MSQVFFQKFIFCGSCCNKLGWANCGQLWTVGRIFFFKRIWPTDFNGK